MTARQQKLILFGIAILVLLRSAGRVDRLGRDLRFW
jgi:hypothetical protein